MILMISIVISATVITITYASQGIYINKFNLEGSLKNFKIKLETKEKDTPSAKK